MPSPFPGMDPYLEAHWGDVHQSMVVYARDSLQGRLPKDLRACIEERVFVESPLAAERPIIPDLRIMQGTRRFGPKGSVALAEPVPAEPLIIALDEPTTQGFIEIRERSPGHRLVTVIELLSLANKVRGDGQIKYVQKREELLAAGVTLVEIDLVRAGERPLPMPIECLPLTHRTPYLAWVRRGWDPVKVEFYRIPLQERLPTLRIPLRSKDADVSLGLQTLMEQAYERGRYEGYLDYREDPDPPLKGTDKTWAEALLRKLRKRPRSRKPARRNGKAR